MDSEKLEKQTRQAMKNINAEEGDYADVKGVVCRMIAAGYEVVTQEPILVGVYCSMQYGGHEVQMKHPKSKLDLKNNKFYCYK